MKSRRSSEGYDLPHRGLVNNLERSLVPRADIPRSKFVGSWNRLSTFNAGMIYPIMIEEVLPGDHLTYDMTAYVRMATPLFPIFDNQRIDTHFFFVPNRLVWTNWPKFMGEQAAPGDSIAFTVPAFNSFTPVINDISDHMGLPIGVNMPSATISALPYRAYKLIYNQWYRDENLVTLALPPTGDGPDTIGTYAILRRAKTPDYFTSALPWPQKFVAPSLPLASSAPVKGIGVSSPFTFPVSGGPFRETDLTTPSYSFAEWTGAAGNKVVIEGTASTGFPNIRADLTNAKFTINELRQAFMVQSLMEKDARGGTRYTELNWQHFGVHSPDSRVQRPEYIGGGSTSLNVTPVAQTAPGVGTSVGTLGAAATALGSHRASYASTEHGYIICCLSIKSELRYQQGVPRHFSRRTRYDFYFPSLANLGEQAILMKEIYATGATVTDNVAFGYQERWQEYRTRYSEVTGQFRSGVLGTLDPWHLAQFFTPAPTLGATFIGDEPPMVRVLAAGALADNQQYFADIQFRRTAVRPMPAYSIPQTLGRF